MEIFRVFSTACIFYDLLQQSFIDLKIYNLYTKWASLFIWLANEIFEEEVRNRVNEHYLLSNEILFTSSTSLVMVTLIVFLFHNYTVWVFKFYWYFNRSFLGLKESLFLSTIFPIRPAWKYTGCSKWKISIISFISQSMKCSIFINVMKPKISSIFFSV